MCGIVGLVAQSPANQSIYDALLLLQHRGQDSTGIATVEGHIHHMHKTRGHVREAFRTRDMRSLLGGPSAPAAPTQIPLPELVGQHVGKQLRVLVRRDEETLVLVMTPQQWSGQGLLGCGLQPV